MSFSFLKKKLPFFAAAFSLPLLLAACADSSQEQSPASKPLAYSDVSNMRLEQIKSSGTFKVAVCPDVPPFAFKSDEKLVGLEIDIINIVAKELKLTPQFFESSRLDASGYLRSGSADLICGAFDGPSISRQFLLPALEYLPAGQRAVIRGEAASFVTDPKQLNSDKITLIAVAGGTGTKLAASLFPNAKLSEVPDFEKGLEDLKAGENCVFLVDNVELMKRANLSAEPKTRAILGFLSSERLSMATRRGDEGFRSLLEAGYKRALASGEIGRAVARYFPDIRVGTADLKAASADSENTNIK